MPGLRCPLLWMVLSLLVAWALDVPACTAGEIAFTSETVVRFATRAEGETALAQRDDFLDRMTRFDLQVRLRSRQPATPDDYVKLATAEVRDWPRELEEKATAALMALRPKLAAYALRLPPVVWLVHTTGHEEDHAAYTRGTSIVLPPKMLRGGASELESLLAHELFHVFTRHNGELREKLYGVLGFKKIGPLTLPEDLERRRITNPDAPWLDFALDLPWEGRTVTAVPLLIGDPPEYDPARGGGLFRYLQFRMLVVEPQGDAWRPVLEKGQPLLLDVHRHEPFFAKVGRNTSYIIHPEEILADNFSQLVRGEKDRPTPGIIAALREALLDKK